MITLNEIRSRLEPEKNNLFARYGISRLGVFGSCARGDNNAESDVDLLVEFSKPAGIEFVDLAEDLERCIGTKVDLVSAGGIKQGYLAAITKDLVYV